MYFYQEYNIEDLQQLISLLRNYGDICGYTEVSIELIDKKNNLVGISFYRKKEKGSDIELIPAPWDSIQQPLLCKGWYEFQRSAIKDPKSYLMKLIELQIDYNNEKDQ